jgi:hypothetical protein
LEDVVVFVAVSDFVVFAVVEEVRVPARVRVPVGVVRIVNDSLLDDDVVFVGATDLVGVELAVDVLL